VIRRYLCESWQIIRSKFVVFSQIIIVSIVFIFLFFTLFTFIISKGYYILGILLAFIAFFFSLMIPTLLTGLEGIFLKAMRGQEISVKDIFMYKNKSISLLGCSFIIGFEASLIYLVYSIFMGLIYNIFRSSKPAMIILAIICYVLICWREGKHIHALNFIAERNCKVLDALRHSRKMIKHGFTSAFLVFLYSIPWVIFIVVTISVSKLYEPNIFLVLGIILVSLCLCMLLLLIAMGATAILYIYEGDSSIEGASPD